MKERHSTCKVFDEMPVYGLVENKILTMHGGLSPQMIDIHQLRTIPKPIRNPTQGAYLFNALIN